MSANMPTNRTALLLVLGLAQALNACNQPPLVVIKTDYGSSIYLPLGYSAHLDGTQSRDRDEDGQSIDWWTWYFNDGTDPLEDFGHPPADLFHAYSPIGIYYSCLSLVDDEGWGACSSVYVKVFEVHLSLVPPTDSPIAYVVYNNDDDDNDGIADCNQTGQVQGEDNLVPVKLTLDSYFSEGSVELQANTAILKVWATPDKQNLLIPDPSRNNAPNHLWPAGQARGDGITVYVEGREAGPGTNVDLSLRYVTPAGVPTTGGAPMDFSVLNCHFLYENSDARNKIIDWPATETHPRSPMFMFGENDPIYVRIDNLPVNQTIEHFNDFVKVTSESGGPIGLTVKEPQALSSYCSNWDAEGELLYLSTADDPVGDPDKIQVDDEEVLTFSVEIQPDSGDYQSIHTVMVDRAEVGVEWQSNYGTYDIYPTLNCADECAQGFYDDLGTSNQVWFKTFNNGDLASREDHWNSSGDSSYADSVDFAYWCGHGTAEAETPRALRFFVDLVGGEKQDPDKLTWSEVDWGDKDMDWVVANTCRFLKGSDSELKQMASGIHLISGYETDMTIYCAAGEYFADKLDEMSIKDAWHKQCWKYQPGGNTSRVFGASSCMNDSLGVSGPIPLGTLGSRDPIASDTYTHSDYTK